MKSILVGSAVMFFASFAMACACGKGSCGSKDHAKTCSSKSSCSMEKGTCACGDKKNTKKDQDKTTKS